MRSRNYPAEVIKNPPEKKNNSTVGCTCAKIRECSLGGKDEKGLGFMVQGFGNF